MNLDIKCKERDLDFWFEEWWEKRREEIIKELEKLITILEESIGKILEELYEEENLAEPHVYGISFSIGPNGEPLIEKIKEFEQGNHFEDLSRREPMTETYHENGEEIILMELPGAEEKSIKLKVSENCLEVTAKGENRSYYKKLILEEPICMKNIKTSYKNGILEIRIKKP
ncbi:hypothetical protein DRN86_03750 [Candidatus Geothermarchaeota archaeon]|nr:MAG: hypothetical protein DRN86_03750 [Candidatus Geothermarchaeota archaeon]